jgi:hypothetical protein
MHFKERWRLAGMHFKERWRLAGMSWSAGGTPEA